ncbi:uncharacterized protein B0I36DRAFT_363684 [Microdochium trichocladiopsis]|uniref:Transcription factor domain-containing protein n=1 Tax=Microdochium trichocladiopsis TaxID=1682393 RepID=A0A9P9BPH3_9PEZI|nr:uncharacterized protein B0I36DRAFT_363684 [Microdochium trichocladiopsis]KAH7029095.1 hypothetical protein B0I36DRAFT_363684 [Microdochium trichocladiopsis]
MEQSAGCGADHLVPEPSLTWLRFYDGLLGDFLDNCLPSHATTEVPLRWLRTLMSVNKDIDALPLAMSALAVSWAGHVRGNDNLVNQGLQIYSFASSKLRAEHPYPGQTQFLATTVLLALYELFEFGDESNKGWICHAAGITTALRTLKPEGVTEPLCLEIFLFVRTIASKTEEQHVQLPYPG